MNNRAIISDAAQIELSREEDSVSSLASLATKDGLIVFAGINSSQAEQDAGKNEHFRAFDIRYPPRKKQKTQEAGEDAKGEIKLYGKRSLFATSTAPKKETYQRLLRLSPTRKSDSPGKRVGAIASGLARDSEIIVFNATVRLPEPADIITRIALPEKAEAADLDIALTPESDFSVAYCDDRTIYEQTIRYDFNKRKAEKRPVGPRRAYTMPTPEDFQNPNSRAKFRCLRFLNSENVIAIVNKPNKSGAELRIFHLYPTGPAIEVMQQNLPRRMKQATSLDVCALDVDKNGNQQFAIAVAGQDISIEVYTINYQNATDTFSSLRSYLTLQDVHKQQMTKVCWAPFYSPPRAPNPGDEPTKEKNGEASARPIPAHPGPQYARLASVSFGNTVVVDTFPLSPLEPSNKDSRYVLSHPSDEAFWWWAYFIVISFGVAVAAMLYASFAGYTSATAPLGLVNPNLRDYLEPSAVVVETLTKTVQEVVPTAVVGGGALRYALEEHHASPEDAEATAVVVRETSDGIAVDVHPDKEGYMQKDSRAKHWHELEEHQKSIWKVKLIKAGQWAEHEGESVLKGVLWSTYAQVANEVLREL